MMSQTHLLVAAALFARPGKRLRNTAVIAGAILPDAAIYVLFIWSKVVGIPEQHVWNVLYWQPPWSEWVAAGNSIFIWLTALLIGLIALRAAPVAHRIGIVLTFAALAALVHLALDFPVHHDDAHRHLWPLSDWIFRSPVSYWNPDRNGHIFTALETTLGVALCVVIFRRFQSLWVRAVTALLALAYIAVPVYFTIVLGGGS
jgi:hypothetical protein